MRYHRLVRDYERRPDYHEAMVLWVTVAIMTRQLARTTTGAPASSPMGQTPRRSLDSRTTRPASRGSVLGQPALA
jgi:hypothetical protein